MKIKKFLPALLALLYPLELKAENIYEVIPKLLGTESNTQAKEGKRKSLMFSEMQLRKILEAKQAYRPANGEKPEAETSTPSTSAEENLPPAETPPVNVEQIYLDSIVYVKSRGSAAWVNGKRMKLGEEIGNLKLASIGFEKVQLVLKIDNPISSKSKKSSNVNFDAVDSKVTFWLKPNQSFNPLDLSIHEGRISAAAFAKIQQEMQPAPVEEAPVEEAALAAPIDEKEEAKPATPEAPKEPPPPTTETIKPVDPNKAILPSVPTFSPQ